RRIRRMVRAARNAGFPHFMTMLARRSCSQRVTISEMPSIRVANVHPGELLVFRRIPGAIIGLPSVSTHPMSETGPVPICIGLTNESAAAILSLRLSLHQKCAGRVSPDFENRKSQSISGGSNEKPIALRVAGGQFCCLGGKSFDGTWKADL